MNLSLVHPMSLSAPTQAAVITTEPAMPTNRTTFETGVFQPDSYDRCGSEDQCFAALSAIGWPDGFRCPRYERADHYVGGPEAHRLLQCQGCRRKISLTMETVMHSTKPPMLASFLAIYLISKNKTGLFQLTLMRQLAKTYRTAWQVFRELMPATAKCDAQESLDGSVQMDDADLGGELPGAGGCGSPYKMPIGIAMSIDEAANSKRMTTSRVNSFPREAFACWAKANLLPGYDLRIDGLTCFAGITDAGFTHARSSPLGSASLVRFPSLPGPTPP